MPSQRPFFLSTFFAAFRQPSSTPLSTQQATAAAAAATANKHTTQTASSSQSYTTTTSAPRSTPGTAQHQTATAAQRTGGIASQLPLHSPRAHGAIPIPQPAGGRRRGSDSSSEGFRDVLGADKWYIGGRTAGGEEKFFKLGVVRRVRSGDRLSLDRLSL